jgi:Tol biopolymer transport system component
MFVVDANGKNLRKLAPSLPKYLYEFSYHWSPDGSYLLIIPDILHSNVSLIDTTTWTAKSIGVKDDLCTYARFSPDSKQLLCRTNVGYYHPGWTGYTVVTLATGESRTINIDPGIHPAMDWSPDGKQLALSKAAPGHSENEQIVVVDADGSNPRTITFESGQGSSAELPNYVVDLLWANMSSLGLGLSV